MIKRIATIFAISLFVAGWTYAQTTFDFSTFSMVSGKVVQTISGQIITLSSETNQWSVNSFTGYTMSGNCAQMNNTAGDAFVTFAFSSPVTMTSMNLAEWTSSPPTSLTSFVFTGYGASGVVATCTTDIDGYNGQTFNFPGTFTGIDSLKIKRADNANFRYAFDNIIVTFLSPPGAPTATSATSVTSTSFSANWNSVSGATGYRLDVSTSNTFSTFISGYENLDVSNVTTYSVTGLSGNTTYYYRVRAYNAGGTSGNSGTVSQATSAYNVTFGDGSSYFAPAPAPNTDDNPVGRFELTAAGSGPELSGVTITFSGTGSDVTGVKLWQSADDTFGSDLQVGTTQSFGTTVTFAGLSSAISTGGTYYFVTLNLGSSTGWASAAIADNAAVTLSNSVMATTINDAKLSAADLSLPVELNSFTGRSDCSAITLSWCTNSEIGNAGFNIFRRVRNTTEWGLVGSYVVDDRLKGMGTSSSGGTYSFIDRKVKSGLTYEYKLQSVSISGTTRDGNIISITVEVPKAYALHQNYPNPFNPTTTIQFDLKEASNVTLSIYNILGQKVTEKGYGTMNAGRYDEMMNMDRFTSGTYFYRIIAEGSDGQRFMAFRKLMLVK